VNTIEYPSWASGPVARLLERLLDLGYASTCTFSGGRVWVATWAPEVVLRAETLKIHELTGLEITR
jgi:hypothetical protein